jgi:outer membrane protein
MIAGVFLVSTILSLGPAGAEGEGRSEATSPLRLTLAEAVERAVATAPRVRQRLAFERGAEADVRLARAARMPQVGISAGYSRLSDVPELTLSIPGAPPRVLFPNIPDNYRTHAGLDLPLFSGGRIGAFVDLALRERAAAAADVDTDRGDTIVEVRTAYWTLVTARETVRVLNEALLAYDGHLRDAENRERFGMAARNEVLAVRVERERAELSRLRATNAAEVAEANLARLIDSEPGRPIETADVLEGGEITRAATATLVGVALEARAERRALAAHVQAAEARVRLERAAFLPQVTVSAAYDYSNPNRTIVPPEASWRDTWSLGVNVGLNVFDGGKASAATAKARAQVEGLRAQLEDVTRRIRLQVTERALGLDAARATVAVAERNLESASENRRVAADRYREGVIASSDLLDAEVALLRAGLDRAESLAAVRLAAAGLERAVGR